MSVKPPPSLTTTDSLQYISINEVNTRRQSRKFGYKEVSYKITFKNELPKKNYSDMLLVGLNEMNTYAKKQMNFQEGDKINVIIDNPKLWHPISTGYKWDDTTLGNLLNHVSAIVTSDEVVDLNKCIFIIKVVKMPRGVGRCKIINLASDKRTKQCIITINNEDNLCAARAIVTGLSLHRDEILGTKLDTVKKRGLRQGRKIQEYLALELCRQLEEYNEDGFTLEDIHNCELILDIQIKIVCAENFNTVIYKGQKVEKDVKIYLYKQGNHFDLITKMKAFFGSSYYCDICDTAYKNKNQHQCKNVNKACKLCNKQLHEEVLKDPIYCEKCNRYCFNKVCFENHSINICPSYYKCHECCRIVCRNSTDQHLCGFVKCDNCMYYVKLTDHKCYMQIKQTKGGRCTACKNCTGTDDNTVQVDPKSLNKCTYTEKYIFFDYEAQQETGIHIPNLVVAHNFEGNIFRFDNNDDFCKWLISKEHKHYTAIAHYARGYDSHFILQYCINNTIKPHTIYSGNKLMLLHINSINLKVIDSHNFIQAPLSTFPKTFGLNELKKGYFPHLFNTLENKDYVGCMPALKFYCPDSMKKEERDKFLKWYNEKVENNYIFDLQKELFEYCNSDVDILRRGCLNLRSTFLEIANIDPFQYITIPSVCMAIYRSKYLKPNTIGIYKTEQKDQYSVESLPWLYSFENPNIIHALNGGEKVICGSKVDGYDESTKTVYQYHGCFWHGCLKCYDESTLNNVKRETMLDLNLKTEYRTKDLKKAGYEVIETWSCEWKKSKLYTMYEKMFKNKNITPLVPRDAFFGGRTEVFKLIAKAPIDEEKNNNKKIGHKDIMSLYPDRMANAIYPIGHPTKIFSPPAIYDKNWFGLIKCKIVPPKNLYIPVLPVKVNTGKAEKLMFPLCYTCAVNMNSGLCNHNDEERSIKGTWATIEVEESIERGYRLLEIDEVWNFKQSRDLWKGYVNDFIKIKLETSPHSYSTNEEYAKDIENKMGIKLDVDKIEVNPGKRAVAKLCLNSLWGKFGQRNNMGNTEYVTEACKLYEILLNDKLCNIDLIFINEDMLQVNYHYEDMYEENQYNTNIFVAIYTTALARLKLYKQLAEVGENVLYCDTDSIVYEIINGIDKIPTGEMLGEWTDELKEGEYITKWVATGPKSYYYITNENKIVLKVKGFCLNHTNTEKITGEAMENLIKNEIEAITVTDTLIIRDKKTKQLKTVNNCEKTLSFNFDKRVVADDYNTYPYGYFNSSAV